MSASRPDDLTPEQARAREALRSLERPRPEAAFRERLKRDFVTGQIGARRVLERPVAWHQRLAWRLALAPAAAVLMAVGVWIANRGPAWTVLSTVGDGVAVVDRSPVPLGHLDELGARLRPGARLEVPAGGAVELASASGLVVEVTAGTEFTLPASPGRWFDRRVAAAVRHGVIRVTTGPAFRGARLRVDTPEATIEVTGTTFAVICEPAGTCVCVHEGVVKVGPRGGAMEEVTPGRRRFVFNDGRSPESAEIRTLEITKLGAFRDRRRRWLDRAGR